VSALPPDAVRAVVEKELDAAWGWAARHDWTLQWDSEHLMLRGATYHPRVKQLIEVTADADGYRAVPPAWRFVRPGSDDLGPEWFPQLTLNVMCDGSPVLCAPWNRLAYRENGGPHENWSGGSWLQVTEGTVAHTIPDMLGLIDAHLQSSGGMVV